MLFGFGVLVLGQRFADDLATRFRVYRGGLSPLLTANSISPSKLRRRGFSRYAIRVDLVLRNGFHEINGS
ncbi:hypothetical protein L6452_16843 [Arctium lappa]|uniref:Uncharacterized protein n=1 Tax=Arctium lappa TaxID=4217 RepID=A0ACB9C1L5_ARCLA|nr:hypothetical protein L6452_16843 [Arctium lappa]